jgi:Nitroreductase family
MDVRRRRILGAAGGVGLALIGGGGLFAITRTPEKALAPWRTLDGDPLKDVRLDVLRYAILAPNPHNRQPWKIRLSGDDSVVLYCDLDRRLPETDPYDRQTLIGFGCFIELARIAAAERGVMLDISEFPEGEFKDRLDDRSVALLRFVPDTEIAKDPLFAWIPKRRSSKAPFDLSRPVAQEILTDLVTGPNFGVKLFTTAEIGLVADLRKLTTEAFVVEAATQRTWLETVRLTRIGKSEIETRPDGISLGGPLLDSLAMLGLLSREQIAQSDSIAYRSGLDLIKATMANTPAYGWIVTDGNSRREQLATGRAYVRMNLAAARAGLGFHPNSQSLQEYPEMAEKERLVHERLGVQGGARVQMLVRLGYGAPVPATPRWPLESHLLGA